VSSMKICPQAGVLRTKLVRAKEDLSSSRGIEDKTSESPKRICPQARVLKTKLVRAQRGFDLKQGYWGQN
jgi:hypothetical protein